MGNLLDLEQKKNNNSVLICGFDHLKNFDRQIFSQEQQEEIHQGFSYYKYFIKNQQNKDLLIPIWTLDIDDRTLYTQSFETLTKTLAIRSIVFVINALNKQNIETAAQDIISKMWAQSKFISEKFNQEDLEILAGLDQLDNKMPKIVKIYDAWKPPIPNNIGDEQITIIQDIIISIRDQIERDDAHKI